MADVLKDVKSALERAEDARDQHDSDVAAALRSMSAAMTAAVRASSEDKAAMRSMFEAMSTSMADIVELLEADEKDDGEDDKSESMVSALVDALAGLKLPAPAVTVQPAPVSAPQPRVDVTVQPAPVTIQHSPDKAGQRWRVEIERSGNLMSSPITALVVTRL